MIYREPDIGHTPCIEVSDRIYAKLEFYNRSGSIKDRPVYNILMKGILEGKIIPGVTTLIEATSGNTGISVACLGKQLGCKVKIVMPCNMSIERQNIMKTLGADVVLCSEGNFAEAIEIRDKLCQLNENYYNVNQFHNQNNIQAHQYGTAEEIIDYISRNNIVPMGFVCGTGTGGTFMGIYKTLKPLFPDCVFCVVEPAESPVMSGGSPGLHGIQGIGDGSKFLVDLSCVDDIFLIDTPSAISAAQRLNNLRTSALPVGVSSGANYVAAMQLREKVGGPVVTIFPDHCNRYSSVYDQ